MSVLRELVQRALDIHLANFDEMTVKACGGDVRVTQQLLYDIDADAVFQQVCGKGIPEGVKSSVFLNPGGLYCLHKGVLNTTDGDMPAGPVMTDTLEEPFLRMVRFPILPKSFKGSLR